MDVLSDILETLRLKSTVYFQADFRAPWGMDIKGGAFANFHLVVHRQCWLTGAHLDSPLLLEQGDVVIVSHGDRHSLMDKLDSNIHPAEELISQGTREGENVSYGGEGNPTRLICGHYEYDKAGSHPLLTALPPAIHMRRNAQSEWLATASALTVTESDSAADGASAVVNRLAEILLIQVIRGYSQQLPASPGFLAALQEPVIAMALTLIHRHPEHNWKLADLAKQCGVSRTILAERFAQTMHLPPIQYLTEWRMFKAREL